MDWRWLAVLTVLVVGHSGRASTIKKSKESPVNLVWVYVGPVGVELTRSEITVEQYRACVKSGACTRPESKDVNKSCNWGRADREGHPINCVDFYQARGYCHWAGARLPTDEEWERVTVLGKDLSSADGAPPEDGPVACYVLGEAAAGCGPEPTLPVCSRKEPSDAGGLCDIEGNVAEWTDTDTVLDDVWQHDEIRQREEERAKRIPQVGFRCARGEATSPVWIHSKQARVLFTKSEITVAQYRPCVEQERCEEPDGRSWREACNWTQDLAARDTHPVNCIDWNQAKAFCAWLGARLPTEEEWRAEASDRGKRKYPWGDQEISPEKAAFYALDRTEPVCSKPLGNSVNGLCDMVGNVWEWTSTKSSETDDRRVVLGGGSFTRMFFNKPDPFRDENPPSLVDHHLGFRCAKSSSR